MSLTLAAATALLASSREIVEADFTGLDLRRAMPAHDDGAPPFVFRRCRFYDASLAGLDLSHATFDGGVLEKTDLEAARLEDSVWTAVTGTRMQASGAVLRGAKFERCTLIEADLSRATLSAASFRTTRLTGASLFKAHLRDTRFDDCHLVAADLRGVSFHRQTLRHVDLSDANLAGADLRDAVLDGCALRGAKLTDARFAGADLRNADLGALTPAACGALRGAVISSSQAAELVRGLGLRVM